MDRMDEGRDGRNGAVLSVLLHLLAPKARRYEALGMEIKGTRAEGA
jgi:hypothetical protein